MPARYRYSLWDGTQEVPPVDADQVLDNLSDDLMNFGDLQHALRNLLQRGMRNPMGDRTQGLRDLLQQLRQQRRQQLDRFDLSSVFDQLREQLDEILDMERSTIDQRLEEAVEPPQGGEDQDGQEEGQRGDQADGAPAGGESQAVDGQGDQPSNEGGQPGEGQQGEQGSQQGGAGGQAGAPNEFAQMLRSIASRKQEFLQDLPEDTAGQVRKLQDYEFMDPEAQAKFNELVESLRQAMMDTFFKDLSSQIANMSPEDLERLKNMTNDINRMLQEKMAGGEPDFDGFMQQYGDLFGDNPPQSLDELVAQMQQQMGQMQSLLGSLPGELREQLQDLLSDKLGDPQLQQGLDELARNLEYLYPMRDLREQYPFRGEEQIDLQAAMELMRHMQSIDEVERQLERTQYGGEIDDIDADQLEELLGPEARETLDELRKFLEILEEAGYIRKKGSGWELTPRGSRKIGQRALVELYAQLKADSFGKHEVHESGHGGERTDDTKLYEFGDPFHLDIKRTIMNSMYREGPGAPVRLRPDDFEVARSELVTQTVTVIMLDLSWSMALRGSFQAAKKVALRAQQPHLFAVPARQPLHHRLQRLRAAAQGRGPPLRALGRVRARHEHAPRPHDRGAPAREAHPGHTPDHHDLRRRAHRPPRTRAQLLRLPPQSHHHPRDAQGREALHAQEHHDQHLHARPQPLPQGVREPGRAHQQGPRLLHHARQARRVHSRRLRRPEAQAPRRPRLVAMAVRKNAPETVREEAVNTLLAESLRARDLNARPERRTSGGTPDVRVELRSGDRVLLECKWEGSASALESQIEERLADHPEHLGVIGVLYPDRLRHVENTSDELASATDLRWWVHGVRGETLPERRVRSGSVADLAVHLRMLPLELEGADRVTAAASVVGYALEQAATRISRHARLSYRIADLIARTDQEKNRAAALRIGCLVLFNAIAFQDRLALSRPEVPTVREAAEDGAEGLRSAWRFVCDEIDYVPVFDLAAQILGVLVEGPDDVREPVIDILTAAMRDTRHLEGHDLAGRLFHTLLTDAKFTGAYYTSVPAATLLARLVFHEWPRGVDWGDHEFPASLSVADLACGTGTLLVAVASEVERRHREAGGRHARELHKAVVEQAIHGYDVQLSAVHFAATSLAMLNPDIQFDNMNLYVMPLGAGEAKTSLGSLDFLGVDEVAVQFALSLNITGGGGGGGGGGGDSWSRANIGARQPWCSGRRDRQITAARSRHHEPALHPIEFDVREPPGR